MHQVDIVLNLTSDVVEQAGTTQFAVVEPTLSVREVFQLMRQMRYGSMLICRDGRLVGIFTERDALRLMAEGLDLDASIETVMVPDPVTLQAGDTVGTAVQRMSSGGYRRMPIVDGQRRPVSMIKVSGIVHYLVEHFPKTVYTQPPVSQVVMQQREGA